MFELLIGLASIAFFGFGAIVLLRQRNYLYTIGCLVFVFIGIILILPESNTSEKKLEFTDSQSANGHSLPKEIETIIETPNLQETTTEHPAILEPSKTEKESKEPVSIEKNTRIDTTVFEYAKNVEITDARDITKHITLKIDLSDGAEAGMGTLNVLTQTYDFLEQDDIVGADTITILVRVNDLKVSQFKISTAKFQPNDEISMATIVLQASDIEFLISEVKDFGEAMELW